MCIVVLVISTLSDILSMAKLSSSPYKECTQDAGRSWNTCIVGIEFRILTGNENISFSSSNDFDECTGSLVNLTKPIHL